MFKNVLYILFRTALFLQIMSLDDVEKIMDETAAAVEYQQVRNSYIVTSSSSNL